jgi:hypothetical protein
VFYDVVGLAIIILMDLETFFSATIGTDVFLLVPASPQRLTASSARVTAGKHRNLRHHVKLSHARRAVCAAVLEPYATYHAISRRKLGEAPLLFTLRLDTNIL